MPLEMNNSDSELLRIENLSVSFSHEGRVTEAVREISFVIQKGETLGVVGESGSGKSVTGMYLMDLLPPEAKISITVPDINASMIFQYPKTALNPLRKIKLQLVDVLMAMDSAKKARRKKDLEHEALDWLNEVNIKDPERCLDSYPFELSGGMCQRVLIAMALMRQPQLLIADEPTTALDVVTQRTIMELILSLKEKHNITVLFITHDLALAKRYCPRLLVMEQGKIVERGDCRKILENPEHPYTKKLVSASPSLLRSLDELKVLHDGGKD